MTEVVAALIWDKNKFLICQRPANKARALLWAFVGGKVEKGKMGTGLSDAIYTKLNYAMPVECQTRLMKHIIITIVLQLIT